MSGLGANSLEKTVAEQKKGIVYLVGAGPGDPRLITLRALQCLEIADVVLYDGLANRAILSRAPQAEKVSVGKHGSQPFWTQQAINQRMVDLAKQGKNVVRLKGGDPAVFARSAEELAVLHENGIAFEVVPGITAALAVACYTGIPLTHRDHASAVALVTGQQQPNSPDEMDWAALASFPGTLIVYMGVTTAAHWAGELMRHGKPASTPVAIVRRCTWGDQVVLRCRLNEVPEKLTPASKLRPPVLVVIGEVAALGDQWNWFDNLPLKGKRIWLPRADDFSRSELLRKLESDGCKFYRDPVFVTQRPSDLSELDRALRLIDSESLDGITFSSVNAVLNFFDYLLKSKRDVRSLTGVRLAAVGPATSAALTQFGLRADLQPEDDFSAHGLLATIPDKLTHQHWLVTTTNHSREVLLDELSTRGAQVTTCLTYETIDQESICDELHSDLQEGKVDCILATSVRVAELVTKFATASGGKCLTYSTAIAMGQRVAQRLTELGWQRIVVAPENSIESMLVSARFSMLNVT